MMKRLLPYVFVLLLAFQVYAQQRPQYQHYIQNGMLINPAVTGIEGELSARVGYRQQWTGIEGAPRTMYATVQTSLDGLLGKRQKPVLPLSLQQNTGGRHGIGLSVFSDRIGPFQQNEVMAKYAYHLPISSNQRLSAGLGLGVFNQSLNTEMLEFANAGDPVTGNYIDPQNSPAVTLGLWYSGNRHFAGVSYYQLFQNNVLDNVERLPYRHLLLSAGYKLVSTDALDLGASTLFKRLENLNWTVDLNLTAGFYKRVWLGISWRSSNEAIAFTRLAINEQIDIAYSFAMGYGNTISAFSQGNHEVSVGFRLPRMQGLFCPNYFW